MTDQGLEHFSDAKKKAIRKELGQAARDIRKAAELLGSIITRLE